MSAAQGGAAGASIDSPGRPHPAPPPSPARACLSFTGALTDGDLARAAALFTREACLITPDATAVHGRQGIATVLFQLIADHLQIDAESLSELHAGDVALVRQRWTIRSERADGIPFARVSEATIVARRIDGDWKIALAAPWGGAL